MPNKYRAEHPRDPHPAGHHTLVGCQTQRQPVDKVPLDWAHNPHRQTCILEQYPSAPFQPNEIDNQRRVVHVAKTDVIGRANCQQPKTYHRRLWQRNRHRCCDVRKCTEMPLEFWSINDHVLRERQGQSYLKLDLFFFQIKFEIINRCNFVRFWYLFWCS